MTVHGSTPVLEGTSQALARDLPGVGGAGADGGGDDQLLHGQPKDRQSGREPVCLDAESGKSVSDDDQVKSYPIDDETYVMLEDEELEAVALESTRTIDIERFVPAEDIGWIWLDRPLRKSKPLPPAVGSEHHDTQTPLRAMLGGRPHGQVD